MRKLKTLTMAAMLAMILVVAASAVAQSNGGGNSGGGSTPSPTPTEPSLGPISGNDLVGRGSDTTYNVSLQLGSLYTFSTQNRNRDFILNAPPTGSSVGIDALERQFQFRLGDPRLPTAFARSSRGPRASDRAGLDFTAFARDAIVPVTFGNQEGGPSANVESLTVEELQGIFVDCTITNFNQIGGADAQIEVFTIQEGSGTRATFDQFLGGDTSNCITDPNNIIFENSPNPILDADAGLDPAERGRAIFPFSFARLSTSVPSENVSSLAVNGVEANADTIADESFPFTRDVFFVTIGGNNREGDLRSNQAADRFVDFVCDAQGTDPRTGQINAELVDQTIESSGFGLVDECETTSTPVSGS